MAGEDRQPGSPPLTADRLREIAEAQAVRAGLKPTYSQRLVEASRQPAEEPLQTSVDVSPGAFTRVRSVKEVRQPSREALDMATTNAAMLDAQGSCMAELRAEISTLAARVQTLEVAGDLASNPDALLRSVEEDLEEPASTVGSWEEAVELAKRAWFYAALRYGPGNPDDHGRLRMMEHFSDWVAKGGDA